MIEETALLLNIPGAGEPAPVLPHRVAEGLRLRATALVRIHLVPALLRPETGGNVLALLTRARTRLVEKFTLHGLLVLRFLLEEDLVGHNRFPLFITVDNSCRY
jgi:hypothetical protein